MALQLFAQKTSGAAWVLYYGQTAPSTTSICFLNIRFDPNGGTWKSTSSTTVKLSKCYFPTNIANWYAFARAVNPEDTVTKSGYIFQGWQDTTTGTTYQTEQLYTAYRSTELVVLTAVWGTQPTPPTTTTVRINYKAGGGTFTSSYGGGDTCYSQGTVTSLSNTIASGTKTSGYATDGLYLHGNRTSVLTRSGYVFKGWKCESNGRLAYTNSAINQYPSSSSSSPYTIDLIAVWEDSAEDWENTYSGQNYKIFSGTASADYSQTTVYWKLLLLEKGNDYENNVSDLYYDFRVKSITTASGSTYAQKDSRIFNYFQLTIKPGTNDSGSDNIVENFTSRNASDMKYYKIESGSTTTKYIFSPFASAAGTNYLTLTEEIGNEATRPSGSCGTIQWPHRINSAHSYNGLGAVKVAFRYYRTESECYGNAPFDMDINYTATEDFVLGKFNRQINYNDNTNSASNTSSQEKQFGSTLTLASAPTWSGHTFNKWVCATDAATQYSAGASFTDDTADSTYTALTMNALWNSTATISLGSGASSTAASLSVVNGDIVTVTSTSPYQVKVNGTVKATITLSSGYAFTGWTINDSPVTGDITVTDNFTLKFNTSQLGDISIYIQYNSGMHAGEFIEQSGHAIELYKTGKVYCASLVETASTYTIGTTSNVITMPAFIEYT